MFVSMKSSGLTTLILKTFGYYLIWLLLSESIHVIHLIVGLFASFGVAWMNTDRSESRVIALRWGLLRYFPWLVGKILQSGFHLSFLILHPALPIDPKLIPYHTNLREDAGVVLLGNSITLTPGTITMEVNLQDLVVHAIDDTSAQDVIALQFERQIARVIGEKQN